MLGKNKYKAYYSFCLSIMILLIIGLVGFSNEVFAQKAKRRSSKAGASEALAAINTIPYSIEVTEESTKKGVVLTLAVEQVTIVHCPEEPLQILFGNNEGIDVSETKPGRTEIYLRPRIAQINTNVVVEMASGPVVLYLHTVEIKGGAKVGQFTSEVVIKNSAYKDALVDARKELDKSKQEANTLKTHITQLEDKLKEKAVSACQESKEDLVKLVENIAQFNERRSSIEILSGKAKVSQIGKLQAVKDGYIVTVAVENRSKDYISMDSASIQGFNLLTTFIAGGRKISSKAEGRFSFLIEVPPNTTNTAETQQNLPKELVLIINQTPVTLKIS